MRKSPLRSEKNLSTTQRKPYIAINFGTDFFFFFIPIHTFIEYLTLDGEVLKKGKVFFKCFSFLWLDEIFFWTSGRGSCTFCGGERTHT